MRGNVLILAGFLVLLIVIGLAFTVSYNRNSLFSNIVGMSGSGSDEPRNVTVTITAYYASRYTVYLQVPYFEIDGVRYHGGTSLRVSLEPGRHTFTVPSSVGCFSFSYMVVNGRRYHSNTITVDIETNTTINAYYIIR